ncbi:MAG: DUF1214 domain-containing protein [Deltaproteobacteria bacterium]|jgi:hypothetical protein|nr:DUF1214 domain-containing protein [Deltaproteobacteria bacterium]
MSHGERSGLNRRELIQLGAAAGFGVAVSPLKSAAAEPAASEGGDVLSRAWIDLCERLKQAAPALDAAPARSPQDRATGYRYLTRLLVQTLDRELEYADPDFPIFFRSQSPRSQQGGPNPDTSYITCRIDGSQTYRIRGHRGSAHLVTFSTMRGASAMREGKPATVDDLVGDGLRTQADGSFEVGVGPERKGEGNWLQTTPETEAVLIRQIFGRWDVEEPMRLEIERVAGGGAPPAPSPEEIALRLGRVGATVPFMADYWVKDLARFLATPNEFKEYQEAKNEDRTIAYTPGGRALVGVWKLAPGEALLIELDPPHDALYWGYELGNYWFEVDYRYHLSSLNSVGAVADEDGRVRTIVSGGDPGGWPNWLDPGGHEIGHMVFRWIGSREEVMPRCRRVALADLEGVLPATTRRLSPAERAEQLARRRRGIDRRWPV